MSEVVLSYIVPAIIGVAGSLVVVVIGNRQSRKAMKAELSQSNKALSLQYITDKRVDWIYAVRNELANVISLSYLIADEYKVASDQSESVSPELYRDLNCSIAKLKLLFNFSGKLDKKILETLDEIISNISLSKDEFHASKFQTDVNDLTQKSQLYLKLEWERVKLETMENLDKEEIIKKLNEKEIELSNKP